MNRDQAQWKEQPLDWVRSGGHADQLIAALDARKKARGRQRIAGLGALVLLLGATVWYSRSLPGAGSPVAITGSASRTLVVAPERRTLPDGTIAELKSGAKLKVDFSADSSGPRHVVLESGEVHFQVAKYASRPFLVDVGNVAFRAVGTAFSVDLAGKSAEMIVTEGTVAVDRAERSDASMGNVPTSGTIAVVTAHNHVVVNLANPIAPAISPLTQSEIDEKLAWRIPRLEFNETPLWEVVSLVNKHGSSRISLASPELGRLEISGSLRADNIDPLLQNLEANYQIRVVRHTAGDIELKR